MNLDDLQVVIVGHKKHDGRWVAGRDGFVAEGKTWGAAIMNLIHAVMHDEEDKIAMSWVADT